MSYAIETVEAVGPNRLARRATRAGQQTRPLNPKSNIARLKQVFRTAAAIPVTSSMERALKAGSSQPNCQTNLKLSIFYRYFIKTIAYHLGRFSLRLLPLNSANALS